MGSAPTPPDAPGNWSPGPPAAPPGPAAYTPLPPEERIRVAWQRRAESDYFFDYWSALGWSLLTCGIYTYYVVYQMVRRSRDHNARRLEMLDAATAFAWAQAVERGRSEELRPAFERVAGQLAVMRSLASEFRDPGLWVLLDVVTGGIARFFAFVYLDGDLFKHDYAEGAVEAELAALYRSLGAPVAAPDPGRTRPARHGYGGRIAATLLTFGLYSLWWLYDLMVEGNRHLEHNWAWEDTLATAVQALAGRPGGSSV